MDIGQWFSDQRTWVRVLGAVASLASVLAAIVAVLSLVSGDGGDASNAAPGTTDAPTTTHQRATTSTSTDQQVDPGDVVGLDVAEASQRLSDAGFEIEVREVTDETVPSNQVVDATDAADGSVILEVARHPVSRFLADLNPRIPTTDDDGDPNTIQFGAYDLDGTTYARALFMEIESCGDTDITTEMEFDLGRDYQRLVTTIGLSDLSSSETRVQFDIIADGEILESLHIELGEAFPVDIDINGILRLTFQVITIGGGCYPSGDGAVLADPMVIE